MRSLVEEYDDWQVGDSLATARPLAFRGPSGALELEQVLWHPSRNLPVVVVSDYERAFLTDSFPIDLASELVGVAIVATADAQVSWGLTSKRGKEWSCYNGAVHLYWPGIGAHVNPLRNPLWTRHTLLSNAASPKAAAGKLVDQVRRELLSLSAFSVPEPSEFRFIRLAHSKALTEAAVSAHRDNQDWDALEEMYAKSNDELRETQEAQRFRIADLESQVANLQVSLRWQPGPAEELTPEADSPPATVQEAVATARRRFRDELRFGSDVDDGVQTLAPDAGPPEKVLMYLERLAEMVAARRLGPLGQSVPAWFRERKVAASGESETIQRSGDEQRKRTWRDGSGRRVFDMHLKPNDGAHPDRCVRIYFDYDEKLKAALVGWVGRHP